MSDAERNRLDKDFISSKIISTSCEYIEHSPQNFHRIHISTKHISSQQPAAGHRVHHRSTYCGRCGKRRRQFEQNSNRRRIFFPVSYCKCAVSADRLKLAMAAGDSTSNRKSACVSREAARDESTSSARDEDGSTDDTQSDDNDNSEASENGRRENICNKSDILDRTDKFSNHLYAGKGAISFPAKDSHRKLCINSGLDKHKSGWPTNVGSRETTWTVQRIGTVARAAPDVRIKDLYAKMKTVTGREVELRDRVVETTETEQDLYLVNRESPRVEQELEISPVASTSTRENAAAIMMTGSTLPHNIAASTSTRLPSRYLNVSAHNYASVSMQTNRPSSNYRTVNLTRQHRQPVSNHPGWHTEQRALERLSGLRTSAKNDLKNLMRSSRFSSTVAGRGQYRHGHVPSVPPLPAASLTHGNNVLNKVLSKNQVESSAVVAGLVMDHRDKTTVSKTGKYSCAELVGGSYHRESSVDANTKDVDGPKKLLAARTADKYRSTRPDVAAADLTSGGQSYYWHDRSRLARTVRKVHNGAGCGAGGRTESTGVMYDIESKRIVKDKAKFMELSSAVSCHAATTSTRTANDTQSTLYSSESTTKFDDSGSTSTTGIDDIKQGLRKCWRSVCNGNKSESS